MADKGRSSQGKTVGRKTGGSLEKKLNRSILLAVFITILVIFAVVARDVYSRYRDREIESQKTQLNRIAEQINSFQSTVQNIATLVVFNDNIQSYLTDTDMNTVDSLIDRRKVNDTLKEYLHVLDGTEEIAILTRDGQVLTSRSVRGTTDPREEDWYRKFNESRRTDGYSEIHESIPMQSGYKISEVSYIMEFHPFNGGEVLGRLMMSIDLDALVDMVKPDTSLLSGYWLLDYNGKPLVSDGELDIPADEIIDGAVDGVYRNGENIYVVSGDMHDNWTLISRMSRHTLLQQSISSIAEISLLFLVVAIVLMWILRLSIRRSMQPIQTLRDAVTRFGKGDMHIRVNIRTGDELEELGNAFDDMVVDINQLMQEAIAKEKQLQDIKTENLMLQINPHFIYNTMNSIVYMSRMSGNDQIADFTNAFISLLQSTLRVRNSVYCTLGEELKTVKNYLYLQGYRYGNKFTYEIHCDEKLYNCRILNVMLQPVVENAIFHGIAPKDGPGRIDIRAEKDGEDLRFVIADDGIGMDEKTKEEILKHNATPRNGIHKIGIGNVQERIHKIFGPSYGITVESEQNVGTRVTIVIPCQMITEHAQGDQ